MSEVEDGYPEWGPKRTGGLEVIEPGTPLPDPSWAVSCPRCKAPRLEACFRPDGARSMVQHGERWRHFDRAVAAGRQQAAGPLPPAPASYLGTHQGGRR